ncbi:MAG: DUF4911 domain-containing protein [Thermodesulfobacteriota bacterium]
MMKDKSRYFLLPPQEIAYVGFLIHSYEGLAVVRTIDGEMGLVEMLVPSDQEEELMALLEALKEEVPITELTEEQVTSMGRNLDLCLP